MNENESCLIVENLSNDHGDAEDMPSQNWIFFTSKIPNCIDLLSSSIAQAKYAMTAFNFKWN